MEQEIDLGYVEDEKNTGTDEPNLIPGNKGKDWINANGGDDYILGSEGNDRNSGGDGFDTKDFSNMKNGFGLKIDYYSDKTTVEKTNSLGEKERDVLYDIERIKGGHGPDEFKIINIEGEVFFDGAGGKDTLNINLRHGFEGEHPEDFSFSRTSGLFKGQPYEAIMSDNEGNILYINDIENVYINGKPADEIQSIKDAIQTSIDTISKEDPETSLDNSAIAHETLSVPISDSIAMLDKINSGFNGSDIDSALKDVLEHEGAKEMLENLEKDGLENLGVPLQDDASPEEFIEEVLMAAHKATIERGLDMPGNTQDNSNTEYEVELSNTNDDFGIV